LSASASRYCAAGCFSDSAQPLGELQRRIGHFVDANELRDRGRDNCHPAGIAGKTIESRSSGNGWAPIGRVVRTGLLRHQAQMLPGWEPWFFVPAPLWVRWSLGLKLAFYCKQAKRWSRNSDSASAMRRWIPSQACMLRAVRQRVHRWQRGN
jgi:hypothetical protein